MVNFLFESKSSHILFSFNTEYNVEGNRCRGRDLHLVVVGDAGDDCVGVSLLQPRHHEDTRHLGAHTHCLHCAIIFRIRQVVIFQMSCSLLLIKFKLLLSDLIPL